MPETLRGAVCIHCGEPHRQPPPATTTGANVMAAPALWFLLRLQGAPQHQPSGNFEEQDLLLTGPGGYGRLQVEGRERGREGGGPGALLLLGAVWGA